MRLFRYDDFIKEDVDKRHFSHYESKGRSQSLDHLYSLNDIEELLNEYAPYFLKPENIDQSIGDSEFIKMYRGVSKKGNIFLVKPSKHFRKARNTESYYNAIIDGSDSWENFPDRSNSLICSTGKLRAETYGKSFRVIPIEPNAKIAISPKKDIWLSFRNGVSFINEKFKGLFQYIDYNKSELPNNLNELNNFLKSSFNLDDEESIETLKEKLTVKRFLETNKSEDIPLDRLEEISKNGNLYYIFEQALSIDINPNFKLLEFSETNRKDYELEKEVWTDADCLMIEADSFDSWMRDNYYMPSVDMHGWSIKDGMSTDPRLSTDEERRQRVKDTISSR